MKKSPSSSYLRTAVLIFAGLSLPLSAVTYWSYSGGAERSSYPVSIGSNQVYAGSNLAVGFNNVISTSIGITLGLGLSGDSYSATVVGQYNKSLYPQSTMFVVGNGAGNGNRSNALEVYLNGDVIIPEAQGDLSMGIFDQ